MLMVLIAQAEAVGFLEGLAIILSVVSLIITVVGFFASLRFYRDGVTLQKSANDALTKLDEKTQFIQRQVGGMFDKTLDAAIGKRVLSNNFEELSAQLEQTKIKLIEESIGQIGAAGEQERKRLGLIVDSQISLLREKLETTREAAEEIVLVPPATLSSSSVAILSTLSKAEGRTLQEIAKQTNLQMSLIRYRLDKLRKQGLVKQVNNSYFRSSGPQPG